MLTFPLRSFVAGGEGAEMPRSCFHVKRGQVTLLDHEGVELADIAEAANETARRGREILAREAQKARLPTSGMIVIDEEFRTVLELPF